MAVVVVTPTVFAVHAPVLPREDDRILVRSAEMDAGRRVVVRARRGHVVEPFVVLLPHLLDDIGALCGEVVLFAVVRGDVV